MTVPVLSRVQVRAVDRIAIEDYGIPGLVLMENAGRGATELLLSQRPAGLVALCCGKGNNGGDGLVMARHLQIQGVPVCVHLFHNPAQFQGDAAINWNIVARSGIPWQQWDLPRQFSELQSQLATSGWIVDALLGTGPQSPLRDPYPTVIACMNGSGRPVFAVDLPTGWDCETGEPQGACIQATLTATFAALKPGFLKPESQYWTGPVTVVQIGVPPCILTQAQQDH